MTVAGDEAARVLVADAANENRGCLIEALSSCGILCLEASDGLTAWSRFTAERPDLVLAASELPGLPALDLLNRVRDVSSTPVVLQVPAGEFGAAVAAIRRGAADVIPLPCDPQELPSRIRAVIAASPNRPAQRDGLGLLIGRSAAARRLREQIRALAGLRIPVLLKGERGSGRDHLALCLAQLDGTAGRDLLRFSATAGARTNRSDVSRTVYLDEIDRHSRVDQAYWSERIIESENSGRNGPRRVVLSTTEDLLALARRGEFDARLAEIVLRFVVSIPPLRDRTEDIVPLCDYIGLQASRRIGRPRITFTESALRLLQSHPWPGNVAQLSKLIEKMVAFASDGVITRRIISSLIEDTPAGVLSLRQNAMRRQRDELVTMLDATGGNLAEAARRMNMSRGAIIYRAQKFGLLAKRARADA
jgi:DNA-binding NtrC family response regulator